MTYEQDRAAREQDATEEMIRMRTSHAAPPLSAAGEIADLKLKLEAANLMWTETAPREGNLLLENDRLRDAIKDLVSRGNAHLSK